MVGQNDGHLDLPSGHHFVRGSSKSFIWSDFAHPKQCEKISSKHLVTNTKSSAGINSFLKLKYCEKSVSPVCYSSITVISDKSKLAVMQGRKAKGPRFSL